MRTRGAPPRLLLLLLLATGAVAVACDEYFGEDPTGLLRAARLVGFELEPDSVDITDAAQTATARASVDAPGGVDSARFSLRAPGGDGGVTCGVAAGSDGTDVVDVACDVTLTPTDTAGSWQVDRLVIYPTDADPLELGTGDLDAAGYPYALEVARVRTTLQSLDLEPDTVDVSAGPATVQAAIELVHSGSGIDSVRVALESTDTAAGPVCVTTSPTGGDRADGLWTCSLTIPQGAAGGSRRLDAVTAFAGARPPRVFDADSILALGEQDGIRIVSGANQPPTATITAPAGSASVIEGDPITFEGSGLDPEDGALTGASLRWSSDLDGLLGTGATVTSTLSVGAHTITLSATDSGGAVDTAAVAVRVTIAPSGHFVFTSDRTGTREFHVMDADGSNVTAITSAVHNTGAAWSPDGSRIAFGDGSDRGIWVMNADGSGRQQLTTYASGGPDWSPDGSELVIQASPADGLAWEIYVIDPATGDSLRRLTDNTVEERYPSWSPDGSRIAMLDADRMALLDAATGAVQQSFDVALARHAAWSPDGTEVAYSLPVVSGVWQIVVLDVATGATRQVTQDSAIHQYPAWSPDGTYIAYSRTPGFGETWDLYLTHADGTGTPRRLTTDPANDFAADWTDSIAAPSNQPPVPEISTPSEGATFVAGDTIVFQGGATDPEDGALSGSALAWTSDRDGALGTGTQLVRTDLSTGTHVITLTATDGDGATGSTAVTITVQAVTELGVSMTVQPDPVEVDSTLSHAITIGNGGPTPVTGLRWTLLVEGDVLISSANQEGCDDFTSSDPPSKLFDCSIDSLAVDEVRNFQLDVVPQQAGQTLTSTLTLESWSGAVDPNTANNTASATTEVVGPAGSPSLTIDAPADNSLVQLGDTVLFQATASDPEDGDLSGAVAWSSSQNGGLGTGATIATADLASGVHTITATVTDSDGLTATTSIEITVGILSMPDSINVTFGSTASVPVNLGEPAPSGGLTVSFSSSDPSVGIVTPSITIPAGATAGNGTVSGDSPGPAIVTASTAGYGSAQSVVSTTASLSIIESSVEFPESFDGEDIRIRFESGGSAAAAPAGGIDVTLSSSDGECVAVPSSVTIPGGQVDTSARITYAGLASAPCSATVTATATDIDPDSVPVQISATPGINMGTVGPVGSGLMLPEAAYLGANDHGGVTVTLTSSDPSLVLLSPGSDSAGTASITVDVPDGATSVSYWVHGVEDTTGTATITASAPAFSDGTAAAGLVQPGVTLVSVDGGQTSLDPNDVFLVRVGVPNGSGVNAQRVRAGAPAVTATVTNSDAAVGRLVTSADTGQSVSVQIPAGQYQDNDVAFDPLDGGTTTVSASIPGYLATDGASQSITVTTPGVDMSTVGPVGSGLMLPEAAYLGASEHGGVTVTLTSSDPSLVLLSPSSDSAGTASITVDVPDGATSASYWVHGVEDTTGTATITAAAPGFTDGAVSADLVQPGVTLVSVDGSQTSLDPNDVFLVRVGVPNGSGVNAQRVRAGAPAVTATVTNSDAAVGRLVTSTDTAQSVSVQIPAGQYQDNDVAFDPLGGGTTTVSASIPGYLATDGASQSITVTTPGISMSTVGSLGSGLMLPEAAYLGASEHGGVTVTLTSSDPSLVLLSPSSDSAGTASITVDVPDGATSASYWVHGVEDTTGTATITASAPAFTDGSVSAPLVQPGVALVSVDNDMTTLDGNDGFLVRVGVPNGAGVNAQRVRAGATAVTATVTNGNGAVGQLVTSTGTGQSVSVQIPAGQYQDSDVAFDPLGGGTTTISAGIPGYLATDAASQSITVTTPGINMGTVGSVGSGLMSSETGYLGATEHGGVTVTLTSSDPSLVLLSPSSDSAGSASITVDVANGATGVSYWVHGLEDTTGTVTITASAPGFTDGTVTADLVQPGVTLVSVDGSQTAGAIPDVFLVRVGVPNGSGVNAQRVRAGGAPLTATVTNSNAAVGQLLVSGETGQSVSVQVAVGEYQSASSVAAGGVAFDPLAAGTTSVAGAITGFLATDGATQGITVQ